MQGNKALEMLRPLKPELCEKFGVERLSASGRGAPYYQYEESQ